MSKLKDLWDKYKEIDDKNSPESQDIQKKINDIETWMIEKGYKTDGLTKFHTNKSIVSDSYPHGSGAVFIEDLDQLKELLE